MRKPRLLTCLALFTASCLSLSAVDFTSTLSIPSLESLIRIQTREDLRGQNPKDNFVSLVTSEAEAIGKGYTVLTDHQDALYLASLSKLKRHYQGALVQVKDFRDLSSNKVERERVKAELQDTRYLAIAPRTASFSENTVLSLLQLLRELDSDPQVDVFPGFLVASSPEGLATIIDTALAHRPVSQAQIQPVAISLVDSKRRTNALQKAGYFRKFFAKTKKETPTFLVYLPRAHDAPSLGHDLIWYQQLSKDKAVVQNLPDAFDEHFIKSNLVLMHGHGTVGESCRVTTNALHKDLTGKVVLSGSCFSAAPAHFDWPLEKRDQFSTQTSFSIRASELGAITSFGHMRLSNGFRYLHPVFEELYAGGSNGEAYHKLLNAALKYSPEAASELLSPIPKVRKPKQNSLLYILFGDPALHPYQK